MECMYIFKLAFWVLILHIDIYTPNGILLSLKKKRNDTICNNVDGTGGYYTWENKSNRERKLLCIMSYTGILKHKTNEYNKTETDSQIQRIN